MGYFLLGLFFMIAVVDLLCYIVCLFIRWCDSLHPQLFTWLFASLVVCVVLFGLKSCMWDIGHYLTMVVH